MSGKFLSSQKFCSGEGEEQMQFPKIELHSSISEEEISSLEHTLNSHFLTLILYNYLQTPKLEMFLGTNIESEGSLTLYRKKLSEKKFNSQNQSSSKYQQSSFNNQKNISYQPESSNIDCQWDYYLLYMINDNISLQTESQMPNERNRFSSSQSNIQLKPIITLLVSLCEKVIVYELDKSKESFIQKVFVDSINTSQKIKWQSKVHINRVNRLVFVRECYGNKRQTKNQSKKSKTTEWQSQVKIQSQKQTNKQSQAQPQTSTLTATTTIQTLQYYSSLSQYQCYLDSQIQAYLLFCSNYPTRPSNPYVQSLISTNKCIKLISLKEILDVYSQAVKYLTGQKQGENISGDFMKQESFKYSGRRDDVSGRELYNQPWRVRYYIEKVYELESVKRIYSAIQYEMFHPNTIHHSAQFIRKEIRKYLTSPCYFNSLIFSNHSFTRFEYVPPFMRGIFLSNESKQKLLWQLTRLEKYQHQLHEQDKISPQLSQDKIFYQLRDDQIFNWIGKYKNKWTEISMIHLKKYFNKIANEKDHKAIQQFKQQCYKMTEKLSKLDIKLYDSNRQNMIRAIQKQMDSFVSYHNDVLQMRRLAGVKFLYQEVRYMLRHKENVRNKLFLFILMIVLALMQKNVIAGITIGTMAVIVLAIRI